ncbi:hypothetical protein MZM54_05240 [[Brevibacterium] frigoritolerans]|nr:hypothetical protein [Peribacillus frigoritolerans]
MKKENPSLDLLKEINKVKEEAAIKPSKYDFGLKSFNEDGSEKREPIERPLD